jgi:hypothetical protein
MDVPHLLSITEQVAAHLRAVMRQAEKRKSGKAASGKTENESHYET